MEIFTASLLLLFFILLFPSTVLNSRTLSFAVQKFGADYRPSWSALSFNIRSPSLLTKRAVLSMKDFCFDETHGAAKGCLSTFELDATIRLGVRPFFSVRRLERLAVHAGDLRLDSTAKPAAPTKKKQPSSGALLPAWARGMALGTIDLNVPRAIVISSSGTTTAGIAAAFRSDSTAPLTAHAYTILEGTGAAPGTRYDAHASLGSIQFREDRLVSLDATARLRGGGLTADARAKIEHKDGDRLKLTGSAWAAYRGRSFNARLEGEGRKDGGRATFGATVSDPKSKISSAALKGCKAEAALSRKTGFLERADLDCKIMLRPAPFGSGPGPKPKDLSGTLAVHGRTHAKASSAGRFETRVDLKLGPVKGYGGFSLAANADLAGPAGGSFIEERRASVKAVIGSFGGLVRFFDGTEYAVPAPLNALDGTVEIAAGFAGRAGDERQTVEFSAKTELASAKQALITALKGTAVSRRDAVPALKVEVDVGLKRIVLQLPYLEIKGASAPMADRRIKTGEPKRDAAVDAARAGTAAKPASAVDYDVRVHTETPIVLSSNLIRSPVPISLSLFARPEGLSGTVRVESFDMEVFRQNARIDHITLTPAPKGAETALDGKIIYKRNDVTVNILLLGTTAKPTVVFESDPPMTQNELVALVLYGKMPNELDSDQKASAGNATAAMTNGAFGLASLYLFASTPVDSVGYDAATQSYQVKFKLPGGATLAVGSNLQESKTLSLRKRLARHWELQTEAGNASGEGSAITTFLQWFQRY